MDSCMNTQLLQVVVNMPKSLPTLSLDDSVTEGSRQSRRKRCKRVHSDYESDEDYYDSACSLICAL